MAFSSKVAKAAAAPRRGLFSKAAKVAEIAATPRRKLFAKEPKIQAVQKAPPPFTPDGQPMPDGSVRYKVLCDGGINPSGVFWSKVVPPGASTADYLAAQAERDQALKQLKELAQAA